MSLLLPPLPTSFNQQQMQTWWQQVRDGLTSSISALEAAQEFMLDIPAVIITADYLGVVSPSSQLPKPIPCQRFNSADDVTDLCEWTAAARNDGVTCSIDSATGILTLTAIGASDTIDVTSTRTISGALMALAKSFPVTLSVAAAPAGGGGGGGSGGSTSSVSDFAPFFDTTYAVVATVSAVAGSSGNIQLSAPLGVTTDAVAPVSSIAVDLIWHDSGGDLGSSAHSSPVCRVQKYGTEYLVSDGGVNASYLKTGLTPGNTYSFDLKAKTSTVIRNMYLSGTASAVGS